MISGTHPWANLNQMQALFKIGSSAKPTIPDQISPQAVDFLEKTFEINHDLRPDADELLKHPFITETLEQPDSGLPGATLSGSTLQSGSSTQGGGHGKVRSKGASRRAKTAQQQQQDSQAPRPPKKDRKAGEDE